jgi:WD40 repeat protein
LPTTHTKFRHFGVSSLNISGDGTRLFSLCKDGAVYAYSTAHLILGHAPELSCDANPPRPSRHTLTRAGLAPLYAFVHPKLQVGSFYVKSALRPARDGRSELLAVGSSDGCAVLFDTDERHLKYHTQDSSTDIDSSSKGGALPEYNHGTPLIRGHDREVGALSWTHDGELVTLGDDFLVRCWREGDRARDLRMGGEAEGRRWGCGWADAERKSYDEDESECW